MNPEEFRTYLRELQKSIRSHSQPNDYFAWQKPDGSLLMIGIKSGRMGHILKHELEEDRTEKLQALLKEISPTAQLNYERQYVTGQYSVDPSVVHMKQNGDGPLVKYDPVEELVQEVAGYEYLGRWHDPDILMDSPHSYSRVLACGRWDLAKEHILQPEKKPSLNQQISQAQGKAAEKAGQNTLNGPSQNHPKKQYESSERT